MIDRRGFTAAALGTLALPGHTAAEPAAPVGNILRVPFLAAETRFDPAQIGDLYSHYVTGHIFEAPYRYDLLALPVKVKTLTAAALPEVSADHTVWTVRLTPGIFFADDPAFKGRPRELVAADYVYAIKRYFDPANKSPGLSLVEEEGFVGLDALRAAALKDQRPFDYDTPVEGLQAIDRHTLRIVLREPRPRFHEGLASSDLFGAVAREVIEFYGEQAEAHPVGTGPFKLVQWRRSSFHAFERNPDIREMVYDAEPAADDAEGQALLARFKGRRLPMIDRVEISIIEEEQPRWLSFVNGEADYAYRVGYQFVNQAMPGGKVAPNLAKRGIRGYKIIEPATNHLFFNMEDETVGGYTPERVALRRAIGLGMDSANEIAYAYMGQGLVAQSMLLPSTSAADPKYKSEWGDYDPARANALLDLYGYVDKDGDGWRDKPDGSPLVLPFATTSNQRDRKILEILTKNMKALGLRLNATVAQWPEHLKAARAGKLPMWSLGLSASAPDSISALARMDSRQIGGQNMARFKMPAFDALYDRAQALPDGPERAALFEEAQRIALAYMPYKMKLYRLSTDMTYPQVIGFRRTVFWQDWWHFVDIDDSLRPAR